MDIQAHMTGLDYAVVAAYVVAVLAIGFAVSRRKGAREDLFLGGRGFGWFNIGLSIFGTNVSPSMLIASCAIAYEIGIVGGHIEWFAWWFLFLLAIVFVPHYLRTRVSTMPEFLSLRYDERCREFLSYYAVFSIMVMWLGGTLYAGGLLLTQIFGWPLWLSVVFLTTIATSFTVVGGLAAVIVTDTFQSILIIAASVTLTLVGLYEVGGLGRLVESVPPDFWELFRPADDPEYPWHAIVLGYPVMGIWFWCTDQTIVQRVLGGRSITQSQLGAAFAAYLKVVTPLIFFLPGIICRVLHPDLANSEEAYMTMVAVHLPAGMTGLVVAVLIAALVSTLDSGLNSLSTVVTLDIYRKRFRPEASDVRLRRVGQIATLLSGALAVLLALGLGSFRDINLFTLLQTIIAYLAPAIAAVFIVGVLWRRANATAALIVLVFGNILCVGVGIANLTKWPHEDFWPHFMLTSFYLFVLFVVAMVVISLATAPPPPDKRLPTLRESHAAGTGTRGSVWAVWAILAVIMFGIYFLFS